MACHGQLCMMTAQLVGALILSALYGASKTPLFYYVLLVYHSELLACRQGRAVVVNLHYRRLSFFESKTFFNFLASIVLKSCFLYYHLSSRLYQLSLGTGNQRVGASFWIIYKSSSLEALVTPTQITPLVNLLLYKAL